MLEKLVNCGCDASVDTRTGECSRTGWVISCGRLGCLMGCKYRMDMIPNTNAQEGRGRNEGRMSGLFIPDNGSDQRETPVPNCIVGAKRTDDGHCSVKNIRIKGRWGGNVDGTSCFVCDIKCNYRSRG